ncbi:MAG: hypothetical protein WCO12_02260 [bacterium]
MNNISIGEKYPQTLKDVEAEKKELLARLRELGVVEDIMNRFDGNVPLVAVIPPNDSSQETVKVFGNNLEVVVKEVCEKWELKHPKTRAPRSGVSVFILLKNLSIPISPEDAPNGLKIIEMGEDTSPRKRVVQPITKLDCALLM